MFEPRIQRPPQQQRRTVHQATHVLPRPEHKAADLPTAQWELIDPKLAEKYLNAPSINRKLRPGRVEQYANDMKAGRWTVNPQPIMFYRNGKRLDGEHRLWAVIESGTSQWFLVVRGVDESVALTIDVGLNRNVIDSAHIAGYQGLISSSLIAIATLIEYGDRAGRLALSHGARLALLSRYKNELEWVDANRPHGARVRNAPVGAALARAYMHESDGERLRDFCRVLSGAAAPKGSGDEAAFRLRNYLLSHPDQSSGANSRDLFLRTMNAIHYFMRREPLMLIKARKEEAYPLIRK